METRRQLREERLLYLSPDLAYESRIPASRYVRKIFDVNRFGSARRGSDQEKGGQRIWNGIRQAESVTRRERERERERERGESRFGSREQRDGESAKSLPRTGKRYKSLILQLKRLTFMVTGQLHLVGSLININRLGNKSLFLFLFLWLWHLLREASFFPISLSRSLFLDRTCTKVAW